MNFLWKLIEQPIKNPDTKYGLVAYVIVIFIVVATLINYLDSDIAIQFKIKIILAFEFTWLISWLFFSKTIIFSNKKIKIGLAINTEAKSREYYKEIKKQFVRNIEIYDLSSSICLIEFPKDNIFKEKNKAEDFAAKKRIGVLVWGDTSEGKWRGEKISRFNINFSYSFSGLEEKDKFTFDIQEFTGGRRNWSILDYNSDETIPVLSNNIIEISLYILGKCLASYRYLAFTIKAAEIFKQLKTELDKKNQTNFPDFNQIKQQVNIYLENLYESLSVYYGNKASYCRYFDEVKEKKLIKIAKDYAEKVVSLNENNFRMWQNLAFFEYVEGNIIRAKEYTQKSLNLTPQSPLPHFNLAFFALKERRYKEMLDEYKITRITREIRILEIISFIEDEFDKNLDNLGFLFAAGWVNIKYADQERGVEQLKDFLKESEKNIEFDYSILIKEAEELIQLIN